MSEIFALDEQWQRQAAEDAALHPVTPRETSPGFWDGGFKSIGMGIERGGANLVRAVDILGSAPMAAYEGATGQQGKYLDQYYRDMDSTVGSAIDFWTPDAREVGAAGRVLGGFSEMLLPLAASVGNPAPLLASQQTNTAADLVNQGVDAETANKVGLLQGAATAVGFRLPFLGKTLASRVLTGAGGNLALNTGTTALSQEELERQGYDAQAEQFAPGNLEARAVDVLSGAAFGALAHLGARTATPIEKAAALTAENAKHYQQDTAPGTPHDLESFVAHQDAMEQATRQLLVGDPVSAPPTVLDASFEPREASAAPELPEDLRALDNQLHYDQAGSLTPEQGAIESKFGDQLNANLDRAIDQYGHLKDSEGGKILNTDLARELSPDYRADRSQSAAVHEPASALVKHLYAQKLAEDPGPGEQPIVMFSAGGTGAGKTTALDQLLPRAVADSQIVYDTNLSSLDSSVSKIEQALSAGKRVAIKYVYRHPIEALKNGALTRATRQEKELGSGRTVPVNEHLDTHIGSRRVIEELAAKYANDSRVSVEAIDNSRGRGQARFVPLSEIPNLHESRYNDLREKALATVESEHAEGRISDRTRSGFLAGDDGRGVQGLEPKGHPGDGGQPQPKDGGTSGVADPGAAIVQAARDVLKLFPNLKIATGDMRPDGSAHTLSATDLLAHGDEEIAKAHSDAKGFEAAVNCILGNS